MQNAQCLSVMLLCAGDVVPNSGPRAYTLRLGTVIVVCSTATLDILVHMTLRSR
jgi:hypothetical protein